MYQKGKGLLKQNLFLKWSCQLKAGWFNLPDQQDPKISVTEHLKFRLCWQWNNHSSPEKLKTKSICYRPYS